MKGLLLVAFASAVQPCFAGIGDALNAVPFYHTGLQIHDSLVELSGKCEHATMSIEQRHGSNSAVPIDVITLKGKSQQATPATGSSLLQRRSTRSARRSSQRDSGSLKAMFVFGEHARELISAESGLHFLRSLCSGGSSQGANTSAAFLQTASSVLGFAELKVVVNANPVGRAEVESGDWCRRTNEDDVDLNRNWDEHFDPNMETKETNPGKAGFSEPETQVLRDVATEFQPTLFLTVHSGALLLGTPHGYEKDTPAPPAEKKMLDVLAPISEKYCDCPYGSLAKLVGYKAPGNAIDYAYDDLGVPFAMTWEIYANPELEDYYHWIRKSQREEKAGGPKSQGDPMDNEAAKLEFAFDHLGSLRPNDGKSSLLQRPTKRRTTAELLQTVSKLKNKQLTEGSDCFASFNPGNEAEYTAVTQKWTSAYFDLLQNVESE